MSFGGLSEGSRSGALPYGNASMTAGEISSPHLVSFSSAGLSLGLQSNRDGKIDMRRMMAGGSGGSESGSTRRNKELDENDSRSGSDNQEAVSGDDIDLDHNPRKKNKRYHRHTPQQIQELESLFKECPHPDEKQRMELSRRLNLESRQVKFWFQNRRTQMKTQIERHENSILRQENDKLRVENMTIREAMRNPICNNCGGPGMLGEISIEEQHLRVENARLKEELDRVCALAGKFLGRSMSSLASSIAPPLPSSLLELGVGSNGGFAGLPPSVVVAPTISAVPDLFPPMGPSSLPPERSLLLELALAAMEELVSMAQMEEPLWIPTADGGGGSESLNYEQYNQSFRRIAGIPSAGYVPEVSRDAGVVIINSLALVETLMDAHRWAEMFPNIITRATTTEIISGGVGGSRNGALQLMNAELQVLSPLVAIRKVNFLRFCKQHAEGIWAVVDVSIDFISRESSLSPANSYFNCRVLPSGCVVQDMANGYSKVTWIEHAEFDEMQVHQLFRPLLRSGIAFGAGRWLSTLQRQCECLAYLMSPPVSIHDDSPSGITGSGRRSMVKLAQRMTNAFCRGVCAAAAASPAGQEWSRLESAGVGEDVRVLTRKSGVRDPGEPSGVVLSVATSVWIPAPPKRLFDLFRDAASRCKWDILYSVGPMLEMARVAKGQDSTNAVSLLRAAAASSNQAGMLILQETCADASGATVVYAPVDVPAMHAVMNGGDSSYVSVLPSGFAVHPDGVGAASSSAASSLLTVGFQILVDGQPPEDSVETVNSLISRTIQKIKTALHCDDR